MKSIKQYSIWTADLNPSKGTEPGKIRPVVVIQSNYLNDAGYSSTIVCPVTTNVITELITRVNLDQLNKNSDILLDQIRAIDNQRLKEQIGILNKIQISELKKKLSLILSLNE